MKQSVICLSVVMLLIWAGSANAAETKVSGRVFSQWGIDLSDNANNENAFELTRAYVDVNSKLSDYTSVRITSDLRNTDAFNGYSIVLKYGYFDVKPHFGNGAWNLRFGLQPTHYIDYQNKLWGRRYALKTASDLYKYLTSSDLGAGVFYSFGQKGKFGMAAANVWNGTSYTDTHEMNKNKDISAFVSVIPIPDNEDFKRTHLVGQFYHGTQNIEIPDSLKASDYAYDLISVGGVLGYRKTFDLGMDLNFFTEGQGPGADDLKSTAFSFFGSLYLEDLVSDDSPLRTLNLFGRVDMFDPNTDTDDDAETMLVGGIECAPMSGFAASVNLRSTSFQDDADDSITTMYVNTYVKF